jgi:hypothetical protein
MVLEIMRYGFIGFIIFAIHQASYHQRQDQWDTEYQLRWRLRCVIPTVQWWPSRVMAVFK